MKYPFQALACVLAASTLLVLPVRAQSVEQGVRLFDARKYADAKTVLLPHGETTRLLRTTSAESRSLTMMPAKPRSGSSAR
ncbi:MAG: hypothetical protein WD802_01805 [Gemmatimonadaceae bacterium]